MTWYKLSSQEALNKLQSTAEGLTSQEAEERHGIYGFNEIPEAGQKKWWLIFFKQYKSLLVIVLFLAALISWIMGHQVDTYVILAVILINTLIGFFQEMRAEKAVASLKLMLIPQAKALRDGEKTSLEARMLVPGDIIILEEGDSIPADARLLESKNLRTIEAPLTGESVPVAKHSDVLPENTVMADRVNMVFKGTFIAGGYAKALVVGTGMQTAFGEITESLVSIKKGKTNFQKKTDVLARQMALIAVVSAFSLFIIAYYFQESDLNEILLISIAALVSAIPEGLPAVLAIVLAIGASRMADRKAIIREFTVTETLGAVTTIITDKTGTLTQNTLTVQKVFIPGKSIWSVTGEGWEPVGNFIKDGVTGENEDLLELEQIFKISALSNNSEVKYNKENKSYNMIGDPTEGALLVLARKGGLTDDGLFVYEKTDDLPFNSDIKMRATLIEKDKRKEMLVVGAPEQVLEKSEKAGFPASEEKLTSEIKAHLRSQIDAWSGEALRVIALAYKTVPDSTLRIDPNNIEGLTFAGFVGMMDPPRPDVKEAVFQCRKAGIRVVMATGDHINTAIAIARATGILTEEDEGKTMALTEKQLLTLNEEEFDKAIRKINVFARLTPAMKLRIAENLQLKGELIAMTGDGVNDAPALKKADVGIAMGIMGTDVARDASQVVLADDNFSTIVKAVEEGRIVFKNTRNTSFFLLTTNFAEITTLIIAVAVGLPVPLTATQILWLNLVTDGTCTTAMATESGFGDILAEKPVDPKEKILNQSILPFLIINAVLMTILALSAFKWFLPEGLEKARSAAFIIMAMSQLFNVFNMRSLKYSAFTIGLFTNKYINIALVLSVILLVAIIEIPFFERIFQFGPIPALDFIILGILASSVLWVGETYKFLRNKIL